MMGCFWGEGELQEQRYELAFLIKKKQTQTTETPQNNNNNKPQECGLSLRHLITGALTNWREFRGKQGEKKKSHQRGQITLRGRLGAEKVPGLEAFQGGAGGGPWGQDEYLGCYWDLAASTSVSSPPRSGESLSSPFHSPFQILSNKQGKIFTVTLRKNIPDWGSWARFLGENVESWSKREEIALGDLGQQMGFSWVVDLCGKPRGDYSHLEVLPPAISICTPQAFIYYHGKGWETASGSWSADMSPREDGLVPSRLKACGEVVPLGHLAEVRRDSLMPLTGFYTTG